MWISLRKNVFVDVKSPLTKVWISATILPSPLATGGGRAPQETYTAYAIAAQQAHEQQAGPEMTWTSKAWNVAMRSTLLVDDFYLGEHTNLYLGDSNIPPAESLFIIQYKGMTEAFEHCHLALRLLQSWIWLQLNVVSSTWLIVMSPPAMERRCLGG
jgi:hypothetical protein